MLSSLKDQVEGAKISFAFCFSCLLMCHVFSCLFISFHFFLCLFMSLMSPHVSSSHFFSPHVFSCLLMSLNVSHYIFISHFIFMSLHVFSPLRLSPSLTPSLTPPLPLILNLLLTPPLDSNYCLVVVLFNPKTKIAVSKVVQCSFMLQEYWIQRPIIVFAYCSSKVN